MLHKIWDITRPNSNEQGSGTRERGRSQPASFPRPNIPGSFSAISRQGYLFSNGFWNSVVTLDKILYSIGRTPNGNTVFNRKNKRRLRRNGQGISLGRIKTFVKLCYFSGYNRIQILSKTGSNTTYRSSKTSPYFIDELYFFKPKIFPSKSCKVIFSYCFLITKENK